MIIYIYLFYNIYYIYIFDGRRLNLIRYVYSVDYVTCSIYVCICAAAILVLSATFELTEWKVLISAQECSSDLRAQILCSKVAHQPETTSNDIFEDLFL